jgi:hypothetical protein
MPEDPPYVDPDEAPASDEPQSPDDTPKNDEAPE